MIRRAAPVRLRHMRLDPVIQIVVSATAFATSLAAALLALEVVLVLYQFYG